MNVRVPLFGECAMERAANTSLGLGSQADSNARGISFLCAGLFIFSFQDVIIKQLSSSYPVHEIVFIRGLVALPLLLLLVHYESGFHKLKTGRPGLQLIRSLAMFCSYLFYYLAIATIPITTAITLFFTAPLFITALSIPILGESVGFRRWIGIAVGFIGVLIMIRPGLIPLETGSLLALTSGFTYSIAALLARRLGIAESASAMAFYSMLLFTYLGGMVGFIIHLTGYDPGDDPTMAFMLMEWRMPGALEAGMLVTIGFIAALGFYLLTQAYRVGTASTVAPFEYTAMLWAMILSYAVWGATPDMYTFIGAALIVAGGVYVLRRESINTTRPLATKGPYRNR